MSVAQPPSIELLQGSPNRGESPRRPVRLGVFLVTFLVCAALGLALTYMRPPVYQTAATVLTVKPKGVDQTSADVDIEHVAIQRRLLLGDEILEHLAAALRREGHDLERFTGPAGLRGMLAVLPVPDTNLVELRAEGGDPELLQSAVDHWAEAYVALRAARIADITSRTTAELVGEQARMGRRIADKRIELEAFRERHDIVSMERDENETLSRLRGLNTSLNKAREEATEARSRLSAVRTALAQGRVVVPDEEKSRLAGLQSEAQALRERLSRLEERYTRRYLELDPNLRDLPEELAAVESQIRRLTSVGQAQVSTDAEQAVLVAEGTVRSLESELAAHRNEVARFSARFAEHRVLEQELERLEELFNDNQERLARIEMSNREQFPLLEVVDRAPLPLEPVRPLYARDAGIALALSVLAALFLAWLVDYLTGRMRREPAVTGVRIFGGAAPEAPLLPRHGFDPLLVGGAAAPQFPSAWPRELEQGEVAALLEAATPVTALQAALLLSGVTPEETPSLAGRVDPDSDTLDIAVPEARSLTLPAGVRRLAAVATDAERAWTDEEMRAGLQIAAADAGLVDAAGITPEALQHTYLVFLVRQGARLGEVARRVGPLPARHLSRYARLSPPGANRPLEEIELFYPTLVA